MPSPTLRSPVGARAGRNASRFIFQWEAADGLDDLGRLVARTGQIISLSRGGAAGAALARDANGKFHPIGIQQPFLDYHYDGVNNVVVLRRQGAGTNSALGACSWSDSTYWTNSANWTLAAATSCIVGQTAYKHTKGVGGARAQTIGVFVNGQTDCLSYIIENVDNDAKSSIGIRDLTAAAWLVFAEFTWATKTIATSGGTAGVIDLGNGRYSIWVTGTGTGAGTGAAGNLRAAYLYPVDTATAALSTIVHHAQFEAATSFPSSPIVTVAAAVTRAADLISVAWPSAPAACTIYADSYFLGEVGATNYTTLMIGAAATNPRTRIVTLAASLKTYGEHHNGTSGVNSTPNTAGVYGSRLEQRNVLTADGSVKASVSKDSATEDSGSLVGPRAFAAAWSAPAKLWIGSDGSGGFPANLAIRSIRYALGVQTLDYMRAG